MHNVVHHLSLLVGRNATAVFASMFYRTLAVSCLEKSKPSLFFKPNDKWWHPFWDEFLLSLCWMKAKNSSSASGRALQWKQLNVLRNHVQSALKTGDHNPEEGALPRYWMPFSAPWQRGGWLFTHTWWGRDTVPFVPGVSYISLLTCGLKLAFSTLNLQGHHSLCEFSRTLPLLTSL